MPSDSGHSGHLLLLLDLTVPRLPRLTQIHKLESGNQIDALALYNLALWNIL